MQMVTALRQQILVPWHKQQAERPKTARQLIQVDQGGMVYQPLTGIHRKVAEIDFMSMYPSVMVRWNISPETIESAHALERRLELLDAVGDDILLPDEDNGEPPGLIPLTLAPLLSKRVAIKTRLGKMPRWDPRRRSYKAQASAHKWLLVTCFGYLGYKNARFGRIEAHEAVTAYGREALLRAKETAEEMGYLVLHMYVDGLWVQKEGAETVDDLQPLLEEITIRTGLPIALEGIYNWVAFSPSRVDPRIPVPNRYYGAFSDGSLKCRGIALRRRDTPRWIGEIQVEILKRMAEVEEPDELPGLLPGIYVLLRRKLRELREGDVPLKKLVASQRLSRKVSEYRTRSFTARAAAQLEAAGREMRPGEMIRFVYTLGDPGVYAWDLPVPPDPVTVNRARYTELLFRAVSEILAPFGIDEERLRGWVLDNAEAQLLPRFVRGGKRFPATPGMALP
jgi:DNA polymerase-2